MHYWLIHYYEKTCNNLLLRKYAILFIYYESMKIENVVSKLDL